MCGCRSDRHSNSCALALRLLKPKTDEQHQRNPRDRAPPMPSFDFNSFLSDVLCSIFSLKLLKIVIFTTFTGFLCRLRPCQVALTMFRPGPCSHLDSRGRSYFSSSASRTGLSPGGHVIVAGK